MESLSPEIDKLEAADLERAYRTDAHAFMQWFDAMYAGHSDNALLQAWHARLNYREESGSVPSKNLLLYTILISTLTWAIAKLPEFISVDEEWFYPRFIPFLVIGALVAYFNINREPDHKLILQSAGAGLVLLLILFLMPDYQYSDSIIMALIHMPLVLISLLGFVFGEGQWRNVSGRLNYIRYGGELIIYTALVLMGGLVLSGLTLGLFSLIGFRLEEWYFSFVGVWGAMSAPLIATWVWDQVLKRESKLASIIANVFSPLFLLMTVAYLLALLGEQRSPFQDREFLIVFNGLLLVVWGISVFSITGRNDKASKLMDLTNLALVFVTLIIDAIALAAIVYRLFEFGITPNRIAVTGANLLIFIHLVWIFYEYAKEYRGSGSIEVIKTTIARYLPVYTGWSVFVVVVLPLLFGFD